MSRNLVDLEVILASLEDYCVLKLDQNEYLDYQPNSDIDILCRDKYKTAFCIEKILNKAGIKSRKYIASNNNLQVDAINENNLELKFDLTDDLSCFSKTKLRKDLVDKILEGKIKYRNIFIPELKYDLAIRLLEYFEYKENPKKIKHLYYCNQYQIEKKIAIEIIRENML